MACPQALSRSPSPGTCTPARRAPWRSRRGGSPAAVSVSAGARTVDAKSVLGIMGLGATSGQQVTVSADGPDAAEAVAALIAILGDATRVGG